MTCPPKFSKKTLAGGQKFWRTKRHIIGGDGEMKIYFHLDRANRLQRGYIFLMNILLTLLFFSGAGSAVIIIKNLLRARRFEKNGENINFKNLPSFWSEAEQYIVEPLKHIIHNHFIPTVYKEIERISGWFRIYILKLENKLFKFKSYIRGKRIIKENGNAASEYLQKLNGFKQNGEMNSDDKTPR